MHTNNNQKFFDDFSWDKVYDWNCAIEPELSWKWLGRNWILKLKFKNKFSWNEETMSSHTEWSVIRELDSMHKLPEELKLSVIDKMTKAYSSAFTVWWSTYASWWVHFHVFWKNRIHYYLLSQLNSWVINNNLLWSLLYCVIDKKDQRFFHRAYSWSNFESEKNIIRECRGQTANLKNDFLPWIEYRANNVVDFRLYGYYVWITILSLFKISLKDCITKKTKEDYVKNWCRLRFNKEDYEDYIIPTSKIPTQYLDFHKDIDKKMWEENIWKIYFVLSINWLTEARKQLEEYIQEYLWIKINAVPFNFKTNKLTKMQSWYIQELYWLRFFTTTKPKELNKMWINLTRTETRLNKIKIINSIVSNNNNIIKVKLNKWT